MKKHLSVLGLWVRSRLRAVLLLLGAMAVLETAVFGIRLYLAPEPVMEELLKGVPFIAAAALIVLFALLSSCGDGRKAVGYTLSRLLVPEGAVILWKALFGVVCFLLLWAAQAALGLGFCAWYAAAIGPARRSAQTVFIAFYRTPFLHALLPLAETAGYTRNALLAVGLGLETALCSCRLRRGGRGLLGPAMAAAAALQFTPRVIGGLANSLWLGLAAVGVAALDLLLVLTAGEEAKE